MKKLEASNQTTKERKKEAEIKSDDKIHAAQHFREVVQPKFRDLLDAEVE